MRYSRIIKTLVLMLCVASSLVSCNVVSSDDSISLRKSSGAVGGGSVFLAVTSTQSWTLEVEYLDHQKDWLSITPKSGTGNRNSVVVRFSANVEEGDRSARITARFPSHTSSVVFTQRGTASIGNGGEGTILPPQDEFPQLESDVVPGWMELPAVKPGRGCAYVYHNMSFKSSTFRNYSIYYDAVNMMAHWVAYPLNKELHGSGSRTDRWQVKDPKIPQAYQPYTEKGWNVGGYDRGHMLPSADRVLNDAANEQTFYPTNMSVQIGTGFNQSIWADLEGRVRAWSDGCDTLYVVTGAVPSEANVITDRGGNKVNVPKAYYKALLEYKKKSSGAPVYNAIAFYFEHKSYSKQVGTSDPWKSVISASAISVSELEQRLGMNFFINLPEDYQGVEKTYDLSYWSL